MNKLYLLALLAVTSPAFSALPPDAQNAREMDAIRDNAEVRKLTRAARTLGGSGKIDEVELTLDPHYNNAPKYQVHSGSCVLGVGIRYLRSEAPMIIGPVAFRVEAAGEYQCARIPSAISTVVGTIEGTYCGEISPYDGDWCVITVKTYRPYRGKTYVGILEDFDNPVYTRLYETLTGFAIKVEGRDLAPVSGNLLRELQQEQEDTYFLMLDGPVESIE